MKNNNSNKDQIIGTVKIWREAMECPKNRGKSKK